jgi:V/A-type H+-transporting ATPase subunit E
MEEAKKQAEKLLSDARARADEIKKKETEKTMQKARELETRELESARLQAKRKLMTAKFRLIDTAFMESFKQLADLAGKGDPSYKNCIQKLVVEAVAGTEGQEFEVIVHPRDAKLVKQKLKQMATDASTIKSVKVTLAMSDEPLRSTGGVVVRTKDGREIFNNTLEARLANVKRDKLVKISDILFKEGTA